MLKELDLAYIAGFFDGEGCVGLYSHGTHAGWRLRVQIFQNHSSEADRLMEGIQDEWGGSLYEKSQDRGCKYDVCGKRALKFLTDIQPYVRIKQEQVALAIEWQATRPERRQRGDDGKFKACIIDRQLYDLRVAARLIELKNKLIA
jgi:hypothetical protein